MALPSTETYIFALLLFYFINISVVQFLGNGLNGEQIVSKGNCKDNFSI